MSVPSATGGRSKSLVLTAMIFAGSSALCGATPSGGIAETWLVAFRHPAVHPRRLRGSHA